MPEVNIFYERENSSKIIRIILKRIRIIQDTQDTPKRHLVVPTDDFVGEVQKKTLTVRLHNVK
jgi:hypothetical protein